MILEQVLDRKMQAIWMDDTLRVALQKLRELDRVNSPIISSLEEQENNDTVQILMLDDYSNLFTRAKDVEVLP